MNTQPKTYRSDYRLARNLLPVAVLLVAFLAFAWHLGGQESDSTLDPATLGLIQQGEDAFKAGHYDKAEAAFRKANKLQHDACFACWLGIAQTREFMKDIAGALKASEKALKAATTDEQRANAHELRGEIMRVEVTGEAQSAFFEHQVSGGYVELQPNAGQVEKSSAKPLAAAEQEFRAAVALAPENATYHLRAGENSVPRIARRRMRSRKRSATCSLRRTGLTASGHATPSRILAAHGSALRQTSR